MWVVRLFFLFIFDFLAVGTVYLVPVLSIRPLVLDTTKRNCTISMLALEMLVEVEYGTKVLVTFVTGMSGFIVDFSMCVQRSLGKENFAATSCGTWEFACIGCCMFTFVHIHLCWKLTGITTFRVGVVKFKVPFVMLAPTICCVIHPITYKALESDFMVKL